MSPLTLSSTPIVLRMYLLPLGAERRCSSTWERDVTVWVSGIVRPNLAVCATNVCFSWRVCVVETSNWIARQLVLDSMISLARPSSTAEATPEHETQRSIRSLRTIWRSEAMYGSALEGSPTIGDGSGLVTR